MILLNEAEKQPEAAAAHVPTVAKLLFPLAPHLSQEVWKIIGNKGLLDHEAWPQYEKALTEDAEFELVIQINSKVRDRVMVKKGINQTEAEKLVLGREMVKKWLEGKPPKKIVFVKDRLINFIL